MNIRKKTRLIYNLIFALSFSCLWGTTSSAIYYGEIPQKDSPSSYNTVNVFFTDINLVTKKVCSGAIISNFEIITAAHCVDTSSIGTSFVYFGDNTEKSKKVLGVNAFPITKFQVSKLRKGRVDPQFTVGDVAIVTIAQPIDKISKIRKGVTFRPLPMMKKSDYLLLKNNDGLLIAGFGFTEQGDLGILKETFMMFRYLSDADQFIFVQPYTSETGRFCYGDSGGPAYFIVKDQWKIAGVISHFTDDSSKLGPYDSPFKNCTTGNEKISTFMGPHF